MDPNATLDTIRELARRILAEYDSKDMDNLDAIELATMVSHLDRWLWMKGFLPERWAR